MLRSPAHRKLMKMKNMSQRKHEFQCFFKESAAYGQMGTGKPMENKRKRLRNHKAMNPYEPMIPYEPLSAEAFEP